MRFKPGETVRVNSASILTGAIGEVGIVCEPQPMDKDMPGHVPVRLENGEWYFHERELERVATAN